MTLVDDRVFAFTDDVPQFDRLVTRARDNLSVVWRERDREDIAGVAHESFRGVARVQVPQSQGLVYFPPQANEEGSSLRNHSLFFFPLFLIIE